MRVHPGSIFLNKSKTVAVSNQQVSKGKEAFLEKKISPAHGERIAHENAFLISRQELMSLASDFKNGLIDRNEAKDRFVSRVIHNSINDKLSDKDKEKLILDISRFFSQDHNFLKELEQNLNNLC